VSLAPFSPSFQTCHTNFASSSFISLEDFVRENDHVVYGVGSRVLNAINKPKSASSLHNLSDLVNLHVVNSFQTISCFHSHLDSLNLLDPNRLRPQWDTYFMVCIRVEFEFLEPHAKITDSRFPCVSSVKLYEASCWCDSRA
jgi:hypothetical protein